MVLSIWKVRSGHSGKQTEDDLAKTYEGLSNHFTLRIHHGGMFSRYPGRRYFDGKVDHVDFVDIDLFSIHELDAMVEELGYVNGDPMYYHFLIPGVQLDYGLLPLGNDGDIVRLTKYVYTNKQIHVYIEHGQTRLHTYFMSPSKLNIEELGGGPSPELQTNRKKVKGVGSCSKKLDYSQSIVPYTELGGHSQATQSSVVIDVESEEPVVHVDLNEEGVGPNDLNEVPIGNVDSLFEDPLGHNNINVDSLFEDPTVHDNMNEAPIGHDNINEVPLDVGEQDNDMEEGSEYRSEETESRDRSVDSIFDTDNLVNDVEVNMNEFRCVADDEGNLEGNNQTQKGKHCATGVSEDDGLEVLDNEIFEEPYNEQDDRQRLIKKLMKPETCSAGEVHKKIFKCGQSFKEKKEVQALIDNYSVQERRDLHYVKNDKIRLRVKCRGSVSQLVGGNKDGKGKLVLSKEKTCPWLLLVSRSSEEEYWVVKHVEDIHTCCPSRRVKAYTSEYLANNIVHQIESNPHIPARALQDELQKKLKLGISKMKAFRAKAIAQKYVYGDYDKQYSLLRDYVMELQNCNPGTSVKIEVYPEPNMLSESRMFKRIYICLGALKKGFKAGLRDFLGFDGAFMKGPFPGQVLTAVGLDANNGIYPVAYAVVEAETLNSWTWFLECLGDDLDLNQSSNFTFITDRQKGVIPAIAKVFPSAEHRYCLRHVHENMKRQWKCKEVKEALWRCASVTNIPKFNRAMECLKKMNPEAHEWLAKIPAKHWARSHFTGRAVTGTLLNNLCEVLNSKLDKARDKPIITCLEYIREYLMQRLVNVQKEIEKCKGALSPTAKEIIDKNKEEATQLRCVFNGTDKYQVTGQWMDQYVVNLKQRTCSCRSWDVSGIPYKHAIAAMYDKMQNGEECGDPEDWVHKCYWLSTWIEMYQHKIDSINGRCMWPKSTCPISLMPPKHHIQIGRPKKKRKKAADEPSDGKTLSRKYLTVTCSKCHNKGHNARSCKGQGGADEGRAEKKSKGKEHVG